MNFALFAAHAEAVELCLYDSSGRREVGRCFLPERDGDIWHGFIPGLGEGTCYGYRVHGPYAPQFGHRHNPHKLLLDPYARQLRGAFAWHASHQGFTSLRHDVEPDTRDNADFLPRAVVCADREPLPPGPRTPWADTRIYEAHLRGFTRTHPALTEAERGTVAGLSADAIVEYLKALGITAVELLPVHAFIDEPFLRERGLSNYWGYNTLAWFAVHPAYLGTAGPEAFRGMVERLHDAGLEVILDVVYNHSCEGGAGGPTLSLRGIDNASYYRLELDNPAHYVNDTGCGNTLAADHPAVRRLVLDSLRYWADTMGVDGFRFDLAPILGRSAHGYDPHAALLRQIAAEPSLSRCKLIGEPWDVGPGGYQLGGFPEGWSEWNDRYRDSVRRFWRGDDGELPELARRLHGSGDVFEHGGRAASASINFVTSHDGFTLRDLVSYARRHNLANHEENRDGHGENYSDNCGVEGETEDPGVLALRARQQRNFIATLLLSQGVPMLQGGDELGRTQRGNNNAYCQDNETSWLDWNNVDSELRDFTAAALALRAREPLLRADRFRHSEADADGQSLHWVTPVGAAADPDFWHDPEQTSVGCLLEQQAQDTRPGYRVLVIVNAGPVALDFRLPAPADGWSLHLDTDRAPYVFAELPLAGSTLTVGGKSIVLLKGSLAPGQPLNTR